MAAMPAILKHNPLVKYAVPFLFISLFALLYYSLNYSNLNVAVLLPAKTEEDFQIISNEYSFSNNSFLVYGSSMTKADEDLKTQSIDLKPEEIDGLRRRYLEAKLREFEKMCPKIKVKPVRCSALFENDENEIKKTRAIMNYEKRLQKPPELFIEMTQNCDKFKRKRGYVTKPIVAETDFPIAFSMLIFKDVDQVDRLLRSIYRPQNYYCIHIDLKAEPMFKKAIKSIVDCFGNMFLTYHSVDVQWGTFSVLEPELICMKQLWKYKKWKYFINLTGQEFPLKTNYELVKILKAYQGANDLEGTVARANDARWKTAGDPPYNITPVKGSVHIIANRGFVDFVLNNKTSRDFLNWTKQVDVPDETFFTSLNHNPHLGVPGAYLGEPETDRKIKPFLARFKNWGNEPFDWPCAGKRVRLICVFGIGDLPLLRSRREMFANKFYWDYEPYTYDCMEELHYNKTRDEYLGLRSFDESYYKTLSFVKHKVPAPV